MKYLVLVSAVFGMSALAFGDAFPGKPLYRECSDKVDSPNRYRSVCFGEKMGQSGKFIWLFKNQRTGSSPAQPREFEIVQLVPEEGGILQQYRFARIVARDKSGVTLRGSRRWLEFSPTALSFEFTLSGKTSQAFDFEIPSVTQ